MTVLLAALQAAALGVATPAASQQAEAEPQPAAGGAPLLEATESARESLLGVVQEVERIDLHGYAASLRVERALTGAAEPGQTLRIAWEELSLRRPPRFRDGERVIVALETLPPGSLWSSRFPRRDALAVTAEGRAFLRAPDAATVEGLATYLALAPEMRRESAGADALARLAASADPAIAGAALERLAQVPGLPARLTDEGVRSYAALLGDDRRPLPLRVQALELTGTRRLAALRAEIEALATPGSALEAPALATLARLDSGLPHPLCEQLLEREDAAVRAVVAAHGGAGVSDERLVKLLRLDPAPEVRASAVRTLVARQGSGALETALPVLFDPDPAVRGAAAESIAGLGEAAVPGLRILIEKSSDRAPGDLAGPLMTLALTGPEGARALREISVSHPDEKIRAMASFALGRAPGAH